MGRRRRSPSGIIRTMPGRESPPFQEEAHDVLAAEEFALPAADPALRHRRIELPDDPTGIEEPHDVLAAEEFALPAPPPALAPAGAGQAASPKRIGAGAAIALLVLFVRRRRRRG
jgi:hypothetical protein